MGMIYPGIKNKSFDIFPVSIDEKSSGHWKAGITQALTPPCAATAWMGTKH
jgi:hypothetical protein